MEPGIMIRCPKTNKPLYRGMTMSQEVFEASTLETKTIGPCPHCGEQHMWSKKDAFLECE
jgi:predicted RNA-binding Zn-ribbon protein involved in translation (DUF1610 family)